MIPNGETRNLYYKTIVLLTVYLPSTSTPKLAMAPVKFLSTHQYLECLAKRLSLEARYLEQFTRLLGKLNILVVIYFL
jgi:hypothetical protein